MTKRNSLGQTPQQVAAGQAMLQHMRSQGQFAGSSFDAEEMSPKAWIRWVRGTRNEDVAEICVIECDLQIAPAEPGSMQGVGMLNVKCPICDAKPRTPGEPEKGFLIVRESNKEMHLGFIEYSRAPKWLRVHHAFHMRNRMGRQPLDEDKIPLISSPKRWQCPYCMEWCVKVTDNIAMTDTSGAKLVFMQPGTKTIG